LVVVCRVQLHVWPYAVFLQPDRGRLRTPGPARPHYLQLVSCVLRSGRERMHRVATELEHVLRLLRRSQAPRSIVRSAFASIDHRGAARSRISRRCCWSRNWRAACCCLRHGEDHQTQARSSHGDHSPDVDHGARGDRRRIRPARQHDPGRVRHAPFAVLLRALGLEAALTAMIARRCCAPGGWRRDVMTAAGRGRR